MTRPMRAIAFLPLLAPLALLALDCSRESPTGTHHDSFNALAGGGRGANDDPFAGGPEGSGPNGAYPGVPDFDPSTGLRPIAYLGDACGEAPAQLVIEDSTAWRIWWDANTGCFGHGPMPDGHEGHGHHGGMGMPGDSGWVDPDSVRPWERPEIDFANDVVIAITLERAANESRTLVVDEVAAGDAGTTVRYTVYRPGADCPDMGMPADTVAPAIAVLAPRPVTAPVTFVRRDTTFDCSWEPDPSRPMMLYYTDAPCELGGAEQIITTAEAWDAWVATALDCDIWRWALCDSTSTMPGPDGAPRPLDYTIPVDFTRYAVIVLRAGAQERWGGGIWLTEFQTSAEGTRIGYTVTEPGPECPLVSDSGPDYGGQVDPTVAIRVPLPLPEPVSFERGTRTIDCNWGGGGGGDSTGTRPPMPPMP